MAQYGYPDADTSVGNWTASSGTDRYAMIDEDQASPDNTDYITVTDNLGATETIEFTLSNVTDPADHTAHSVVVRSWTNSGFSSVTLNVDLKQGATSIKNEDFFPTGTITDYTMNLSEAQAANITNYNDLNLVIKATDGMAMGSETRVHRAYFTCPSVGGSVPLFTQHLHRQLRG